MYTPNDYSSLLGMDGFSDDLLTAHFGLYEGYVKNTNTLLELLPKAEKGSQEYIGLNQRFGWEFNGMRLHELYFENMSADGGEMNADSDLAKKIIEDFGSLEEWKEDFIATSTIRGIGWTILYKDPRSGRLMNVWINEHDLGHLSGAEPLLILDVFEHAYMIDYGVKRAEYVDAFFNVINWQEVEKRFAS